MKKPTLWLCWLYFFACTLITVAGGKWHKHTVIKSDAAGYYAYLPATVIYKDPLRCKYYWHLDSVYNFADGVYYYAVQYYPETQNFYFKYNYGVALLQAPAFFIAHAVTVLTGQYPADGYSDYYQLAIALNTVLFALLGLLVLRRWLLAYYCEWVTAIVLTIIAGGTNFFAQIITQPGLSHVYLFFVFATVLYATQQLYATLKAKYFILLGLALGICAIIRPVDLLVVIVPLLWAPKQLPKLVAPGRRWWLLAACFIALVLIAIQLVYWKYSTGHWYIYTYKREHFNFTDWQIINGLFSFRKGWFVYTPLALLGFIGCYFVWRKPHLRFYLLPFAVSFTCCLYITFCWWQWYYGGSFGCRPLVEWLTLLALPMAAFIEGVLRQKMMLKYLVLLTIATLMGLNIFQTAQYAKGIIHWQKMNAAYYWRVFGQWKVTEEDKQLLQQTKEIERP